MTLAEAIARVYALALGQLLNGRCSPAAKSLPTPALNNAVILVINRSGSG